MNEKLKKELGEIIVKIANSEGFEFSRERRPWIKDYNGMFSIQYDGYSVNLIYEINFPMLKSENKKLGKIQSWISVDAIIAPEDVSYGVIMDMYNECKQLAVEIKMGEMNE